ncbi:hypothetical protein B0T16DRAFT_126185 [Cercophora newfieldiana]|uniref:Uncharacterized protein n=1 Tax=Cercophora newfieldiana TaxID=92897 RepID=A0AA39YAP6_9PEZI|nr:hypothetical protein B0T16DRAFT_126185 [Cercophora newfieldiana]
MFLSHMVGLLEVLGVPVASLMFFAWSPELSAIAFSFTFVHACRCGYGTAAQIMGSDTFVSADDFTSGKTLFCTQSGITGSTSGPIQLFDLVVVVKGVSSPMVMRRCGKELEIVGEAYVGSMPREALERLPGFWEKISIR